MIERNWSGALASPSPPWEEMREPVTPQSVSSKKVKKGHRRYKSAAVVAIDEINKPRLVRSAGMRRDWSFEDFRKRNAFRIKTTPTQDEEIDY